MKGDTPTTLRDLRLKRDLTVAALGCLIGRNKSTVSRVERGKVTPTPETTVAIARALGVSVERVARLSGKAPAS